MNRNLFLAILSLDSYNRGYQVNVGGLSEGEALGNAIVKTRQSSGIDDTEYTNWQTAGFYASAYQLPAGYIDGLTGTVISYRGTNFNFNWNPSTFLDSPIIKDVISGWSVGAGLAGQQAVLALDFYNAVAPDGVDPRYANITTTGHSLGGGLAGLAANVYNRGAVLFDHMPYGPISATLRAYLDARARFFGGEEIWAFSDAGISALSTEDEILSYFRLNALGLTGASTPINSHSDLGAVQLHSMALLVSLLWAQDNTGTQWQAVGEQLWNAYFDTGVANSITNISDRVGASGANGALQAAIAYSALGEGKADEGEKPFGDTAIWSMFNDAGDLGQVIAGDEPAFFGQYISADPGILSGLNRKDVKQYLADADRKSVV